MLGLGLGAGLRGRTVSNQVKAVTPRAAHLVRVRGRARARARARVRVRARASVTPRAAHLSGA